MGVGGQDLKRKERRKREELRWKCRGWKGVGGGGRGRWDMVVVVNKIGWDWACCCCWLFASLDIPFLFFWGREGMELIGIGRGRERKCALFVC